MREAAAAVFGWLTTENGTPEVPHRKLNSRGVLTLAAALLTLGWVVYAEGVREQAFRASVISSVARVQAHDTRLDMIERRASERDRTLARIEEKVDTLLLNMATRRGRQEQ